LVLSPGLGLGFFSSFFSFFIFEFKTTTTTTTTTDNRQQITASNHKFSGSKESNEWKWTVEDQNVEKVLTSFIEDNLTLPATVRVSDDVLHKLQ
jgi:hypothetical protein